MKMKNKTINLIFMLFLLVDIVYGIGISPSRAIINFEPNVEHKITYTIWNQGDSDTNVRVYVKGNLNESIVIPKESILVPARSTVPFDVTIKLPGSLDVSGTHDNRIGVVESSVSLSGETMIGAITGVESQLYINVPYSGKYLEVTLEVGDVIVGEPLEFKIILNNLGSENIVSAKGIIKVFDPNNNQITSLNTDVVSIKTKESSEIKSYWIPKDVQPGNYKAIVSVDYDGKVAKDDASFKLGDLLIQILKFNAEYVKENKIVRFDIELQSLWNEIIPGVYGEIKILDLNGKEIDKIKTEPLDVPAWAKRTISQYWPIKDYGMYKAEVTLNYADKTTKSIIDFEIKKNLKLEPIYIVVGLLFTTIIILLILYIRTIKKQKNENK